jgi:hypothetical protein
MSRDEQVAAYAPGSIRDREERWLAAQDTASLRATIYNALPRVLAANDLEARKPFLALEEFVRRSKRHA